MSNKLEYLEFLEKNKILEILEILNFLRNLIFKLKIVILKINKLTQSAFFLRTFSDLLKKSSGVHLNILSRREIVAH